MWYRRRERESAAMIRTSRFVRTPRVRATTEGEETVLLDVERGRYYALNEVGSRIWSMVCERIASPSPRSSIAWAWPTEPLPRSHKPTARHPPSGRPPRPILAGRGKLAHSIIL